MQDAHTHTCPAASGCRCRGGGLRSGGDGWMEGWVGGLEVISFGSRADVSETDSSAALNGGGSDRWEERRGP